jgi:Zn-dependent protease with chaperone function
MGVWVRTVVGVALLAMFPAMLLMLLAGLVGIEIVMFSHRLGTGLNWLLLTVPAALVLLRGLRVLLSRTVDPALGFPVHESAQPELWALVRRIAEVAGTRPPDEIYLNAEANASVTEETRLLGLVSTRRRLYIGTPLMAGLRADQLAAVLTHELAHYGNQDTRLSALAYRGRRALVSAVHSLDADWLQKLMRRILKGWMKLYMRASAGLSQRQERAADEAAARAVGSDVAAGAWREIPVIGYTWGRFADNQLIMGWSAGYLPEHIFAGYAEFVRSLGGVLDRLRAELPDEQPEPYDTHPPMRSRVAAIEAMRATPVVEVEPRAATSLLHDARTTMEAGLFSGLVPAARQKHRVGWETLAGVHGMAVASEAAGPLLDRAANLTGLPKSLGTVLAALDKGLLVDLAGVEVAPDLGRRAAREYSRPYVHTGLSAVVLVAVAEAGLARWTPEWPSGVELVVDDPRLAELTPLIDAAVADRPDTAGLRALLQSAGVDLDRTSLTSKEDLGSHAHTQS